VAVITGKYETEIYVPVLGNGPQSVNLRYSTQSQSIVPIIFTSVSDQNESGGRQKRKNLKANENAMYCNRRTRDKQKLSEWIHDLEFVEIDPRTSKSACQ
jgi:hypothetical protein